jgi:AAA+ ATPase superfamily predicted ATPase
MANFIGRQSELKILGKLLEKTSASLVVVKGRRRIGKSRLLEEFGKQFAKMFFFSGLPPTEKTTLQSQLDVFGLKLGTLLGQPAFKDTDWSELFSRLAFHTQRGKILIVLDEISWMGSKDHNFLGKLKNAWDLEFKKNDQLVLVLCGSVSTWIEKNIISNTGFLGRISLNLTVKELPLEDCDQFWAPAKNISPYEKFKVLAVTGGVPKYLEEIRPRKHAEENIRHLCFEPSGLLFQEFEQIFSDLFSTRSKMYKEIVQTIADGSCEYDEIYRTLGTEKTGAIGEYLDDLIQSGFIQRDFTWHLKTGRVSKLSKFRISDNYLRFYLKYILPQQDKIIRGAFEEASLTMFPGWEGVMGLQFENLVLNNRKQIHEILGIKPDEIVYDNPFFQRATTRHAGCQIDYLIQTRFDTLYVCEIKFQRQPVSSQIIKEVETKIQRLSCPRHISQRPILIHVNGVMEEVLEAQYFAQIIDFGQLLTHT